LQIERAPRLILYLNGGEQTIEEALEARVGPAADEPSEDR
jgi:hypothetical protein